MALFAFPDYSSGSVVKNLSGYRDQRVTGSFHTDWGGTNYSALKPGNPLDRGTWQGYNYGVANTEWPSRRLSYQLSHDLD